MLKRLLLEAQAASSAKYPFRYSILSLTFSRSPIEPHCLSTQAPAFSKVQAATCLAAKATLKKARPAESPLTYVTNIMLAINSKINSSSCLNKILDHLAKSRTRLGALIILAILFLVVATLRGPGLSPDSVVYASVADSIADHGTFTIFNGEVLTIFPPGLPILLGIGKRLGINFQFSVVILNALSLAISIFTAYLLANLVLSSSAIAFLVAACFGLSLSIHQVYSMLWTEPLFIALSLIAIFLVTRSIVEEKFGLEQIWIVGLLVSAASLLRFVGVTLLPAIFVGAFVANKKNGLRASIWSSFIAVLIASLGVLISVARNISLGAPPFGYRYPSDVQIISVAKAAIISLGKSLMPISRTDQYSMTLLTLVGLLYFLLFLIGLISVVAYRHNKLAAISIFSAVYWLILLRSQFTTRIDPIDTRYLSPVYVPMLILAAYGIDKIAFWTTHKLRSRPAPLIPPNKFAALCLAALIGMNLFSLSRASVNSLFSGIAFNDNIAKPSELASALTTLPSGAFYCNNPYRCYWHARIMPIREAPIRGHYWSPEGVEKALRELAARSKNETIYLVLFKDDQQTVSLAELEARGIHFKPYAKYRDGQILRSLSE